MDALIRALATCLLALVPTMGQPQATHYAEMVARHARYASVDPWLIVAIGRLETNWNPNHIGRCCAGLMSIHWAGWRRYAEEHNLPTDQASLRNIAVDADRNIEMAAHVLRRLIVRCHGVTWALGAYESGHCRYNRYGRLAMQMARRYRQRYGSQNTTVNSSPNEQSHKPVVRRLFRSTSIPFRWQRQTVRPTTVVE